MPTVPRGRIAPGQLDPPGQRLDERAVIERPGQRIAAGRLEQVAGLAGHPGLGAAEDDVDEDGRGERAAEDHQQRCGVRIASSWARIGVASRQTTATARTVPLSMIGRYSRMTVGFASGASGWLSVAGSISAWTAFSASAVVNAGVIGAARRRSRHARGDQRAVGPQERRREDVVVGRQGGDPGVEQASARSARERAGRDVAQLEIHRHEAAHGRRVAADGRVEQRRRFVGRGQVDLARGGDRDDQQESGHDQQQEQRSNPDGSTARIEHALPADAHACDGTDQPASGYRTNVSRAR